MSDAIDLRLGRWQDALRDVECDALISDPPYSPRTDKGYRAASDYDAGGNRARMSKAAASGMTSGKSLPRSRFELQYKPIDQEWVRLACESLLPRTKTWAVVFGDHVSARWWSDEIERVGWLVFAPVPWIRTDSAPRFMADGPANACEWITVARRRGLPDDRFSRPGWYKGSCQGEKVVTGGKPLDLMRQIVRDYSRPGDLICDPCAGGATTLLAAAMEGRRAVGSEMDPKTFALAQKRIAKGYTPPLPGISDALATAKQEGLGL